METGRRRFYSEGGYKGKEVIVSLEDLLEILKGIRGKKKIVFTNGCFDILHAGHADYLERAKNLGDVLIVGVNSDTSIKRIKGPQRPVLQEELRLKLLDSLKPVDFVVKFEEDTPIKLIEAIKPDVLVKGGDWPLDKIVGKDLVESYGGTVTTIPFRYEISTSKIIERVIELYCSEGKRQDLQL